MRRSLLLLLLFPVLVGAWFVPHAPATESPACPIPPGVLRFFGGGEGDPNSVMHVPVQTIPTGMLRFFGGGEGDPADRTVDPPDCYVAAVAP